MATGFKSGGRQKGTPNGETKEIRDKFQMLVEGQLETLEADLKSLRPGDRIKMTIELAKFCLPTLKAIDFKGDIDIVERPQLVFRRPLKETEQ
jgi:hypothetical protein